MGVIELQVFVSLVVILGAAFVALICDFLKGNNEQLRESNIVLRVREDERTRSEAIVERVQERVQRQTLEVLAQVQRVSGQRPAVAAKPAAPQAPVPVEETTSAAGADTEQKDSAPRGYAERSSRVRRPRPVPAEPAANAPAPVPADAGATWAQDVLLRRYPHTEPKPEPEVQPEPVRPLRLEAFDIRQSGPAPIVAAKPVPAAAEQPAPSMVQSQQALPLSALPGQIVASQPPATPEAFQHQPSTPASGNRPELDIEFRPETPAEWTESPVAEAPAPAMAASTGIPLTPAAAQTAEPAWSDVPVLQDASAAVPSAGSQLTSPLAPRMAGTASSASQSPLTLPTAQADITPSEIASAEADSVLPVLHLQAETPGFEVVEPAGLPAGEDPQVVRVRVLSDDDVATGAEPQPEEDAQAAARTLPAPEQIQQPVELQPAAETEPEPVLTHAAHLVPAISLEDTTPSLEEILSPATLESEPWLKEEAPAPLEARSNVVEMPVSSLRPQEPEKPAVTELAIPGGFHEAAALARLMEDERPFHGLVLAISVVDHVRLLADQGKPATEQLMATVTRLVVSMAREQDFVCRIDDDEFILIFGRETGAAAKRRIQLVSERLWDFQLRSLGSVSVIFSWGASESQAHPLMQAVENAREQMMETRRNRRAYNSGANRFRRRTAN